MKQYVILVGLFALVLAVKLYPSNFVVDKVRSDNYTIEVHSEVITKDGYILTLHRIPFGRNGVGTKKRQPVFLMHSLFSASDNFVFLEPSKSLGYLLADRGYDVWMGNVRATSYCRRHVKYDPDRDKEFWNFTLTEMAKSDLTASIDYILDKTKYSQLQYIGYSQGNVLFFMMSSLLPEYQKKISLYVALSPAVFLKDAMHPMFGNLHEYIDNLLWFSETFRVYELHPGRDFFRILAPKLCPLPGIDYICQRLIGIIAGYNPKQFNKKYLSSIVSNGPEGTGMLQFVHLLQFFKTGKFQEYDYGKEGNLIRYGSESPPKFNVEQMKVPAALYYSEKDLLVPAKGVEKLAKVLPNVVDFYKIEDPEFTHLDFVIANDIVPLLYDRVLHLMDKYKT